MNKSSRTRQLKYDAQNVTDNKTAAADKIRGLVHSSLEEDNVESARYFADKLVHFTGRDQESMYLLAKCHLRIGAHSQAVSTLEQAKLLFQLGELCLDRQPLVMSQKGGTNHLLLLQASLLAATCHVHMDQLDKAMQVLELSLGPSRESWQEVGKRLIVWRKEGYSAQEANIAANLCCLRGKVRAKQGDRQQAVAWLKMALQLDTHCVEAVQILTGQHLISSQEKSELLGMLHFSDDEGWLKALYISCLGADNPQLGEAHLEELRNVGLHQNSDVLLAEAERAYMRHDAEMANVLCEEILQVEPYHERCLALHAAALTTLGRKPELFYLAHCLVKAQPAAPHSWFAVGAYYLLLGKNDIAQRYFLKSTKLAVSFCPGWVGFGCALSAKEEAENAVAAYRSCERLFPGQHLPLLYAGMEYIQMNNLSSGFHFLQRAVGLCSTDPLIYNELGTAQYKAGDFAQAVAAFQKVLEIVGTDSEELPDVWETTVFNLGQCFRKLQKYEEAKMFYFKALTMRPNTSSTHCALAFTYHLQGNLDDAIEEYHKALSLKPENSFASDMLLKAIKERLSSGAIACELDTTTYKIEEEPSNLSENLINISHANSNLSQSVDMGISF